MSARAIPGYILKKKLGAGAMASVFLAKDEKLHRDVALKVMSKKLLDADPSFVDRFLREARIVASVSHRNIVTVFDVGSHQDFHYMAMEFLPGGDLSSKLKQGLPIEEGIGYIIDIAEGLNYAASKNLIHRDIKPDNIMFAEDGHAVITDFGIARDASSETNMTMAGTVIGTPQYMSPEQAGAKELDHRTDLYSLGIILYQMLAGKTPFKGDSAISTGIMHISEPVPPLPARYSQFQSVIDKALAKNPDDRFQSGTEFIEALRAIDLTANDYDDEATMVWQGGEQEASADSNVLSDLSDEFMSTSITSPDEENAPFAAIEDEKSALEQALDSPPRATNVAASASTENLSLTMIEEARRKKEDEPAKEEKDPFTLPLPRKSWLVTIVLLLSLLAGHVYYVNILGKAIPFENLASKVTNLSHELSGTAPNLYGVARVFGSASQGLGKLTGLLLGDLSRQGAGSAKTLEFYLSQMDRAMLEGRLYAPASDCAEYYLQEVFRLDASGRFAATKANELMGLSLETMREWIRLGRTDEASKLAKDSDSIIPYVTSVQLLEEYDAVASHLGLD